MFSPLSIDRFFLAVGSDTSDSFHRKGEVLILSDETASPQPNTPKSGGMFGPPREVKFPVFWRRLAPSVHSARIVKLHSYKEAGASVDRVVRLVFETHPLSTSVHERLPTPPKSQYPGLLFFFM
jgi:hypothetical protein